MEHAASIIETDISIIPFLSKVFAIFQMRLFNYKHNEEDKKVESIFSNCSNCDRSTGLPLKIERVKKMSTKDVLNTRFHHVGFSWRIYSSKPMKYDIKENNNPDWLNKGPRYNIAKMLGLNSFIKIMKLVKNVS